MRIQVSSFSRRKRSMRRWPFLRSLAFSETSNNCISDLLIMDKNNAGPRYEELYSRRILGVNNASRKILERPAWDLFAAASRTLERAAGGKGEWNKSDSSQRNVCTR